MSSLLENVQDFCPENVLSTPTTQLFLALVNTLFAAKCSLGSKESYPQDYSSKMLDGEQFDFIIVGAGSAGSVLSSKLSEYEDYRILIIEAGTYPTSTSDIPALLFNTQLTNEDWIYKTEPNENHCLGYQNGSCYWPRGKVLGGSSSINAMLYIRGNKKDYDIWSQEGNIGWDYENVINIYKKIENIRDENLKKLGVYGTEGPLQLTRYKYSEPIRNSIIEAFNEFNIPNIEYEDMKNPIGIFDSLQNIYKGERINSAKAFLKNTKNKNNIFLSLNSLATKIIIDKKTKEAKGVEVIINKNNKIKVYATKEIIISSGSINTPQLLMLSGIGPKNELKKHNIDLIEDLPVGENLQDHFNLPIYFTVDNSAINDKKNTYIIDELYKYLTSKSGEFSEIRLTNLMSFINTKNDSIYPDIQFIFLANYINDFGTDTMARMMGYSEEMLNKQKGDNKNNNLIYFWIILLNPKSRGNIKLKNSDPFEKPIINAGYLTDIDNNDIDTLLQAVRFSQKIENSTHFVKHNAKLGKYNFKNCNKLEYDSDEFWKCCIRHAGTTLYHPTSTCRMGTDPKNSVVDSNLRVHNIKNLRIADASIMPHIVSGNTNGPSMMIGLKASEIILEFYNKKYNIKNKHHTEL